MSLQPAVQNVNPDIGSGATLNSIRNFVLKLPVPTNATLNTFSLTPGFGYGGTPTVALESGKLVLRVPGPVAPNTNFQLPKVTMNLTASGAALSNIQSRLAGTSYDDPGVQFLVNVTLPSPLGSADLQTDCYPTAQTPLSTTQILPFDNTPPQITINTPADGAVFPQGGVVNASFSCNDGPFGVGVATCNGTVANGTPINTATLGQKTFTVTSTDVSGNGPSTASVNYTVVSDPPAVVDGGWATEGAGATVTFPVRLLRPATETTHRQLHDRGRLRDRRQRLQRGERHAHVQPGCVPGAERDRHVEERRGLRADRGVPPPAHVRDQRDHHDGHGRRPRP